MIVQLAIPEGFELGTRERASGSVHDQVAWAVHGSLKKVITFLEGLRCVMQQACRLCDTTDMSAV